jgi:hypothetical protein
MNEDQLRELLMIRERKITLLEKEVDILKQIIASQKPAEIEPVWVDDIPIDRADLETDEYPHYDELTKV